MSMATPTRERQGVTRTPGTYQEYLALEDEPRIVEWDAGEIIEHMPPTDQHQSLVRFLIGLLNDYVELLRLGRVQVAPFEVKLWPEGPSREPDILFVSNERLEQLGPKRFLGGPDLVVEVVSTSSARADRVEKFLEYERAGVREYWVIDPRHGKEQADFYQLNDAGHYVPVALDEQGVFVSGVLPGFRLAPATLWGQALPPNQLALAEIAKDLEALPDDVRAAYRALYEALRK